MSVAIVTIPHYSGFYHDNFYAKSLREQNIDISLPLQLGRGCGRAVITTDTTIKYHIMEMDIRSNTMQALIGKPAAEFTLADITAFVKDNGIGMVNFTKCCIVLL